jgi:hypothetical protein
VLRKIFGPKREEVVGGCRRMQNEELQNLHVSTNIVRFIKARNIRWPGYVSRMGEINAYKNLIAKPEGKRPLGRPRRRCEDNIKLSLGK